jgi:hypothetical protein
MQIKVPVSVGELVDKLVILEIKSERIGDAGKRANVVHERDLLRATVAREVPGSRDLDRLTASLKQVNEALWEIEDDIRDLERAKDFGARFVELARGLRHQRQTRRAQEGHQPARRLRHRRGEELQGVLKFARRPSWFDRLRLLLGGKLHCVARPLRTLSSSGSAASLVRPRRRAERQFSTAPSRRVRNPSPSARAEHLDLWLNIAATVASFGR